MILLDLRRWQTYFPQRSLRCSDKCTRVLNAVLLVSSCLQISPQWKNFPSKCRPHFKVKERLPPLHCPPQLPVGGPQLPLTPSFLPLSPSSLPPSTQTSCDPTVYLLSSTPNSSKPSLKIMSMTPDKVKSNQA